MPATISKGAIVTSNRKKKGDEDEEFSEKNVTLTRDNATKQIIIPDSMSVKEAIAWLVRKDREEENEIAINHQFECFPLDGAVAFRDALDEIFGYVESVSVPPTWFTPKQPPVMIGVPVGFDKIRQVPWGRVQIPGIEGHLETSYSYTPGVGPKFVLLGETKQRHQYEIQRIVEKTREKLKQQSIYKGKAITIDLAWMRDGSKFNPMAHSPKFNIPVDTVREEELIFSTEVQRDVELGLFTPIEQVDQCRKHGIPIRRGVMMAGPYGTGKTLTAYVTAKKAVNNGFTFIYLKSVLDLAQGFQFARMYAPAVIFAEDVDQVFQGDRSEEMNAVLNAFDGVDGKSSEIITVLTTNHLERITQAALRPGRCDTLVQVTLPDEDAAVRLVMLYARGQLDPKSDLAPVGKFLSGHFPAEIRECVERAKLATIRRMTVAGLLKSKDATIEGHVTADDIIASARAMANQHALLQPQAEDKRNVAEKLMASFAAELGPHVKGAAALAVKALSDLRVKPSDILEAATAVVDKGDDKSDEDDAS